VGGREGGFRDKGEESWFVGIIVTSFWVLLHELLETDCSCLLFILALHERRGGSER
jgi:hypothetical protein